MTVENYNFALLFAYEAKHASAAHTLVDFLFSWSGNRIREMTITSHLLYLTELSFGDAGDRNRTDAFQLFRPVLSMSHILHLRLAEHETGNRPAPVGTKENPNHSQSEGPRS